MLPARSIHPPTARRSTAPPGGEVPFDMRLAALARRQGGVVSRGQLVALGLSPGGVDARVARGALHVVHRGVYAVGHPIVRGLGREHAAVLATARGAVRTHRTAGANFHLRAWTGPVELTAGPWGRSKAGVIVHRHRLHPDEITELDGLPISTVARTVFDLAEVLTRQQYERTWQEGERLRLIDLRALRTVAERNPGRRALAIVLPLLGSTSLPGVAETRSPLEVDFVVFAAHRLGAFPPPLVNSWVHGFEVDVRWPQACLTVELDSRLHHDNDQAFERDRAKWNALAAAGELVFPLTARRLRQEPAVVAAQLTGLLRERWR